MADSRVIVACAGSGKTRNLITRLLELLKNGARPGEILIITFTNKAAAEIRQRLLAALKASTDPLLADYYQRILLAKNPADDVAAHTFHSWFMLLLKNTPWQNQVFGMGDIIAEPKAQFAKVWRQWQQQAEQQSSPALLTALVELSPERLYKVCEQFIENRHIYRLYRQTRGVTEPASCDINQLLTDIKVAAEAFIKAATGGSGKTFFKALEAAERLASGESSVEEEYRDFLTAEDKISAVLCRQAEKNGYEKALQNLCQTMLAYLSAEEQRRAEIFNQAVLAVCEEVEQQWQQSLDDNNEITFNDIEQRIWRLLQNDAYHALSLRLYMRYRHILIDEFQDTSPMQWQIIRRWLLDAHGNDEQPSVFIVGDTKQAIYGFRHGDSRLLHRAEHFLQEFYQLKKQPPENICYRCGDNIIKVINATFNEGRLNNFRPHESRAGVGGRVEWHAIAHKKTAINRQPRIRNPLKTPATEENTERWNQVADKVAEILREWRIQDGKNYRPCVADDILILMRHFTHVTSLADALAARQIPVTVSGGETSFIDSFECADIIDWLSVLLSPTRNYALARALKSPLFSWNDDLLTAVATVEGEYLWDKLQHCRDKAAKRARVLLKFWHRRASSTLLPAHDFLSKLLAQGDIIARYQASVAPSYRARVAENIERLLDLSLLFAGGTRPLLSQFVFDMRHRQDMIKLPSVAQGARLMTIHAAKGLQSPVVILADIDFSADGGMGDSADILVNWPVEEDAPRHFVVSLRRYKRAYLSLKATANERRQQEKANLLYVAMTRAAAGLIIFSPATPKGEAKWAYDGLRCLTDSSDTAAAIVYGDSMRRAAPPPAAKLSPPQVAQKYRIGDRKLETAAMARGEIRHQLLALLLSGVNNKIIRELVPAEEFQWRDAKRMAASKALKKLLSDSQKILIEREFALDGKIIRPDLVILSDKNIWIVDYKTAFDEHRHRAQLETYRRALAVCYPQMPIQLAVLDIKGRLHCI